MPKTLRGILEELAYSFYSGEKISKKKTNQVINTIEESIDKAQKDIEIFFAKEFLAQQNKLGGKHE